MSRSASAAWITTTMNVTVREVCIAAWVCRIFLGKDALVTSHNENGGGKTNQNGNAKASDQLWQNLSLGCSEQSRRKTTKDKH